MPKVITRYLPDATRADAGARINELVKQYRLLHPERSYEDCLKIIALENDALWNSYASPECPDLGPVMQADAGKGIAAAAARLQADYPSLTVEQATLRAMEASPSLARCYVGFQPAEDARAYDVNRAGDTAHQRIADQYSPEALRAGARQRILERARFLVAQNDELVARKLAEPMTLARAVEITLSDVDWSADNMLAGDELRKEFGLAR